MRVQNVTASYVAPTEVPFLCNYTAVAVNLTNGSLTFTTADDSDGTNATATVIPAGTAAEVVLQGYVKASAAVGIVLLGN